MPKINFNQAKEWLDNITSSDTIAVIHHDDGDGFASGILFYDFCKQKNATVEQFTFEIGTSKIKKWDLEKFNKIIITDLAPDLISDDLIPLENKDIFYTDHHLQTVAVPKSVKELRTLEEGYIPSSRTAGELTNLKPWLSLAGTITDAGDLYSENEEFIEAHLKEYEISLEDFKQEVSSILTNTLTAFEGDYPKAFETIQKIESIEEMNQLKKYSEKVEDEIEKFIKEYETKKERLGDINFYYFEPKFSVRSAVSGIISRQDHNEIYIFAGPKKGTEKITLSARNTSQRRIMSELLAAGTAGLKDAGSGGHPAAAGASIRKEDLEQFKKNIRDYVENN